MDWLYAYEEELRLVFEDSRRTISAFPEPLQGQGMSYLDHFNVFTAGSHKNYICYLLPFWLRDGYGLTVEVTRQMSRGNVFLMLYFFIQDDLMDSHESFARSHLPLANLFYVEFLKIYRQLFPSDSPFWSYFSRYISEWADSVSNEHTGDYFNNNRLKISHKASPLKLSSTAALLLTGHDEVVTSSEAMMDDVLFTLQMLDDYEDWEEDWTSGSYNSLLSLANSHRPEAQSELTLEEVRDFVFTTGGMERFADIARATNDGLSAYALNAPHLYEFHQLLSENLAHISSAIEEEKRLLQAGGLSYWLSKNMTDMHK
ncbi:hypothetical protein A8L34_22075 [Bacillus sp. FJAT-27264]|uniref:hypothetical protein n=1 Tax=Paenibacillus sp. (strain DSM 101736 / FJAT-27264) TaxID=1850362 RepID=UPI000807C854|nr:hypothetical protein [Bacillus sp. FJAT-27264]OBZ08847.1 hypothetical protein A8L34_22075 [Bacillus sp. FJAT-27264]